VRMSAKAALPRALRCKCAFGGCGLAVEEIRFGNGAI